MDQTALPLDTDTKVTPCPNKSDKALLGAGDEADAESGAEADFFQIHFHQMFQVKIEVFDRKLIQKFRLGRLIDLDDALNNLMFTISLTPVGSLLFIRDS